MAVARDKAMRGEQAPPEWVGAAVVAIALVAAVFAVVWAANPDFFASLFHVDYAYGRARRSYARNLGDFPKLLAWLAGALATLGVALRRGARLRGPSFDSPDGQLPRWLGWSLVGGLFAVATLLSHRSWVYWSRNRLERRRSLVEALRVRQHFHPAHTLIL